MGRITLGNLQRALAQLVAWVKSMFATKEGYEPSLRAGKADRLCGLNSVPIEFTKRTYTKESGTAKLLGVKGMSIVWNQFFNCDEGVIDISYDNTGGSVDYLFYLSSERERVPNHIYYCRANYVGDNQDIIIYPGNIGSSVIDIKGGAQVVGAASTTTTAKIGLSIKIPAGQAVIGTVRPMFVDLTKMFGAGNEPLSADEFESLFPLDYYPYNNGVLVSNVTEKIVTRDSGQTVVGELPLNLTTITGKVDGDDNSVVVCPDGLMSVGAVCDEAVVENGSIVKIIKRIGRIDLGTIDWGDYSAVRSGYPYGYCGPKPISDKANGGSNIVTVRYDLGSGYSVDKKIIGTETSKNIYVIDSAFVGYTGAQVAEALSGTIALYELANPVTYVLDTPIPTEYDVVEGGTEERIPSDISTELTAPFRGDVIYPATMQANDFSLLPDLDKLVPIQTIEYNVSRNGWCKLFERENPSGTTGVEVTDVVVFRITVTGEGVENPFKADVLIILNGTNTHSPFGIIRNMIAGSPAVANRGIASVRLFYPKAVGNGYGWGLEFSPSTSLHRHIRVDIFKTSPAITFYREQVATTVNSTYQNVGATIDTSRIRTLSSLFTNIEGSSTSSAYLNGYYNPFIGSTGLKAGEGLNPNEIAFVSTDGMVYGVSNTGKAINPDAFVVVMGTNYNLNNAISYAYIRTIWNFTLNATANPGVTIPTFALGDQLFLRCHITDGKIYSDAVITKEITPGYTWFALGYATSATAFGLSTFGKEFFTLDANGKLTHVNGREIAQPDVSNLAQSLTASAKKIWGGTAAEYALLTPSNDTVYFIKP